MQEKSTFVKLHRKITKWRWYQDANTFRVFVHLIIKANVYDNDFENITVHRGQVVTSIAQLAKDLKISVKSVRTALEHLKSTGEVAIKTTSKYSIITVINYDDYQKVANTSANEGQAKGTQGANEGQQYKKEKNIKNVKKEREDSLPQKQTFGEFENVYLTEAELSNLNKRYPNDYLHKIEHLSAYLASSGKAYNNHYAVLLQWLAEDLAKAQNGGGKSDGNQRGYVQGYRKSYAPSSSRLMQEPSYDIEELENDFYFV